MGKGTTMGVGRGRSVIGITLGILIIECAIGAAAVALADESQGQYVDFVVWQLAWLTVPLLAVAAYWHPRRWGWFGVAAGVPQIVVGVVAMERQAATTGPAPLGGLGVIWGLIMMVAFVIVLGLGSGAGQKTRSS